MATLESKSLFEESVSCLCWAHNEEQLIESFLFRLDETLRNSVVDFEIIVSDDYSTDSTRQIVKKVQQSLPHIILIENPRKDFGNAVKQAIQRASKEFLFWQTVDWSYDISRLRVFLELLREYNVVAGIRPPSNILDNPAKRHPGFLDLLSLQNLRIRSDNLRKGFISLANYLLVRLLFGMPLSDFQNVVFWPTRLIQSIVPESNSSFLNPEFLLKAYWRGERFIEVPIPFLPRIAGKSKGTSIGHLYRSTSEILYFWYRWIILGKRDFVRYGAIHKLDLSEWR